MNLPPSVEQGLEQYVEAAKSAFGSELVSIVLYGSAAEGRLRASSDVNTITVARSFSKAATEAVAPALTVLATAIRLETMFVLEAEIEHAMTAFPVKFADIGHRRHVLTGTDPFAHVAIPRGALITRLRQVLLNFVLRTRQGYALRLDREDRLVELVADLAGPLRSSAAALLELNGTEVASPREALDAFTRQTGNAKWLEAVAMLSAARENRALPEGRPAGVVIFELLELGHYMLEAAHRLDA